MIDIIFKHDAIFINRPSINIKRDDLWSQIIQNMAR